MNSAPWWLLLMSGAAIESACNMLWCIWFIRMDSLTPGMFSWLLVSAVGNTCVLGVSVCVWSYFDTKRRHGK
jgi:hypothetical protein